MDFGVFFSLFSFFESFSKTTDTVPSSTTSPSPIQGWSGLKTSPATTTSNPLDDCRGVLGCFPIRPPWEGKERPVALSPESLSELNPFFCLHSSVKPECQKIPVLGDEIFLPDVDVSSNTYLVIITHGFTHSSEVPWVKSMVFSFLENLEEETLVIVLDWSKGATPPYAQAVANTRLMGALTGHLILRLVTEKGLKLSKTHLVGHSLGSHLFGYAGSYVKKRTKIEQVGRITGMDPAGPYFRGTAREVRLDDSDAYLVDVLHTDSTSIVPTFPASLGIYVSSGNLDFYPNGGGQQKGCSKMPKGHLLAQGSLAKGVFHFVSCSHERAIFYIINSLSRRCQYIGVECDSWKSFKEGKCWGCDRFQCFKMGIELSRVHPLGKPHTSEHHSPQNRLHHQGKNLKLFLTTTANKNTCGEQYRFSVSISPSEANETSTDGEFARFSLVVRGETESFETFSRDKATHLRPGDTLRWVDTVPDTLGKIGAMVLTFAEERSLLNPSLWRILSPTLRVREVVAESLMGDERISLKVCEEVIKPGETKVLRQKCHHQFTTPST